MITPSQKIKTLSAAAMLLCAAALSTQAQTFTSKAYLDTTTADPADSYYFFYSLPDMTDTTTGQPVFGGIGHILCTQLSARAPGGLSYEAPRTYSLLSPSDIYKPGAVNRALDVVNWLVDTYYFNTFLLDITDPAATPALRSDFQYTIWELRYDFLGDPDVVGTPLATQLDLTTGTHRRSHPFGSIIDDLVGRGGSPALYDTIPTDYRSSEYEIHFLKDADSEYQDMLLITPIPEVASSSLTLVAGAFLLIRRRR